MKRVVGWFTGLTPQGWLLLGLVAALIIAGIVAFNVLGNAQERTVAVAVARDAGTVSAIASGQAQTLDQLKDANDAERAIEAGGERNAARYAECLQNSRRPAACERYNPEPRAEQLVPGR